MNGLSLARITEQDQLNESGFVTKSNSQEKIELF